jgi:hypothetical protein
MSEPNNDVLSNENPRLDDPAGRIAWFIREMASRVNAEEATNRSGKFRSALAQVLGVTYTDYSPEELAATFTGIANLWVTAAELQKSIADKDLPELYQNILPEVRSYLAEFMNLTSGYDVPSQIVRPSISLLTLLDLCSNELSLRDNEDFPSAGAIDTVRKELSDFLDFVQQAKIQPELAGYVLEQLHLLANAVDQYAVAGKRPSQDAVAQVLGRVLVEEPRFPETSENRKVVQRLADFVNRYAGLMCLTATGTQIGQTVMMALQVGSHPH